MPQQTAPQQVTPLAPGQDPFGQSANTLNASVQANQDAINKAAAQKAQLAAFGGTQGLQARYNMAGGNGTETNQTGSDAYAKAFAAAGGQNGPAQQRTAPSDSNLALLKAVNPAQYTTQVQNYGGQAAGQAPAGPPMASAATARMAPGASATQNQQSPQQDPHAIMLKAFGQHMAQQQHPQGMAQQAMAQQAPQASQGMMGGTAGASPQQQQQGSGQGMNASGFANAFTSANPAQPKALGFS